MMRILLGMLMALVGIFPARAEMLDYPAVQLKALDKSTARTTTVEVKVGETIQYGSLYIKVQACRKAEPLDAPESAAFLQIWELPPEEKESRWVFSGWMFASSPALSAMDHPVFDVWVLGCSGREEPVEVETPDPQAEEETEEDAGKPAVEGELPVMDGTAPAVVGTAPEAAPGDETSADVTPETMPETVEETPLLD